MVKDYMLVPCEIKNVKEDTESGMITVDGYASIYDNIDLGNDRVRPSFFVEDLIENGNERPALWQHMSSEPVGIKFYETDSAGLKFTAKMPMDDTFVMGRVYPQMKVGSVKGVSIGYWVLEEEYNRDLRCNDLIKGALRESSFVTFPMNPKACIFSVRKQAKNIAEGKAKNMDGGIRSSILDFIKSGEIDIKPVSPTTAPKLFKTADISTPWDESEAIQSIKDNTGSADEPSRNYGIGFLKSGDGKAFDTYGLPYVKYIDNEFQIIPEAIYKAAGAIWNSSDPVLKDFVNQVYKKLGQEEPFKAGDFFIDASTLKNLKDLDVIFDDQTMLSTEAKQIVFKALRSPAAGGSVPEGEGDLLKFFEGMNKDMKIIQEDFHD